jgi:hypothetical protein
MVRLSEIPIIFPHINSHLGSALDFYPEASQSKGCGFESHVGCSLGLFFALSLKHRMIFPAAFSYN